MHALDIPIEHRFGIRADAWPRGLEGNRAAK
jgi:hypothetical protein